MQRLLATLALSLTLLSACGASDPKALADEASAALNSGKHQEAAKLYEKALAGIGDDRTNPDWLRYKLGWVQAEAKIDAKRSKDVFLELAAGDPTRITDKEFSLVASRLGDAGDFDAAAAVLGAGMAANPESVQLKAMVQQLGDRQKSMNKGGPSSLKGLGYVGDDE